MRADSLYFICRRLWVGAGSMGAIAVTLWPRHRPEIRSRTMGGFGVLAWLAIGAAGGWTITRLMVTAGHEGLRGTAAGMVGGILGGLGMELFESPWARSNDLHTLLAALTGSVWLAWITCAVTSGRERGSRPRARAVARVDVHRRPLLWTRLQTLAARMGTS